MSQALLTHKTFRTSGFLPAYQELSEDLLKRLYVSDSPTRPLHGEAYFKWRAAIAETTQLIGTYNFFKTLGYSRYERESQAHNKTIDWLDFYYPMWRGYTW